MVDWSPVLELFIFSVLIPSIVAFLSGEFWVNYTQSKHRHSEKIANSIKLMKDSIIIIYPRETRQTNEYKIIGIKEDNFRNLSYDEYVKSHIESGYLDVANLWKSYKILWGKYNDTEALFREIVRSHFHQYAEEHRIPIHYHREGVVTPEYYFNPYYFSEAIWEEIKNRSKGFDPLRMKPTKNIYGDKTQIFFYEKLLFTLPSNDEINKLEDEFYSFLKSEKLIEEMHNVKEAEFKLNEKEVEFKLSLTKIYESIELGENIKGKCDTCTKLFAFKT